MHGPPPPDQADRGGEIHAVKTYLRLMRYVRPYWMFMALTLLLALFTAFCGVLPQQVIGVAVNRLSKSVHGSASPVVEAVSQTRAPAPERRGRGGLPIAPYVDRLIDRVTQDWFPNISPVLGIFGTYGAVFLLLFLISNGFQVLQGLTMAYLGQSIVYNLRNEAYGHLQRLSLKYFEDRQTGDIMSRVVNDVNSLEQVIVGPVVQLLTDFGRLCFLLYFCLRWDWLLTVLALGVTPLLMGTTWVVGRLLRKDFRALRQKIGELNGMLQDNVTGIRVIKAFGAETKEEGRFRGLSSENYRVQLRLARMFTVFRPLIGLLNHLGTVIVLCVGGIKVAHGELEVGVFVVFFEYLRMMYGPITGLTRFYNFIQRALASGERVFELLDETPDITDAPGALKLEHINGDVSLQGVTFGYLKDRPAVKRVSLEVKAGEMVALVGPSGSGKSTLVNLLLRFYDPDEGCILIDGHDLRSVTQASLRKHVSVVLQDPFLFNESVRNNLSFGRPDASEEEIVAAAVSAGAHEFIEKLPNGYDTVIGERGVKLSGGQRQRLSIARAILIDPRVLILDEATSSVDTETEQMIQDAIYRMAEDRTTIVIAHRLSTVQRANRTVVLEDGCVVEMGTHAELLAKSDGLYARLWESGAMFAEEDSSHSRSPGSDRTGLIPPDDSSLASGDLTLSGDVSGSGLGSGAFQPLT